MPINAVKNVLFIKEEHFWIDNIMDVGVCDNLFVKNRLQYKIARYNLLSWLWILSPSFFLYEKNTRKNGEKW